MTVTNSSVIMEKQENFVSDRVQYLKKAASHLFLALLSMLRISLSV